MKQIQVGLMGYGLSGRVFHGPLLKANQGFNVSHIYTKDPEKAAAAQLDFPGAQIVSDVDPIFESNTVELVVICTPNIQHSALAKRALETGKHTVVEKPFTVTSEEAAELAALAREHNRVLSVYQNRRFDGDFKTLKQLIDSEKLGRIVSFESRFDRYRPEFKVNSWREDALPGSGILYDLGSHLIDQALCLFGLPDELYADISSERRGAVEDAFEVVLYYPELKVTLTAANLIKEPTPRFALYGTKGAYVKYGLDPQEEALREGKLPLTLDWGAEPEAQWGILNDDSGRHPLPTQNGSYPDYYQGVYQAIVSGEPLPVTAEDGLAVIRLIEAALLSHESKARVSL